MRWPRMLPDTAPLLSLSTEDWRPLKDALQDRVLLPILNPKSQKDLSP